MHPSLLLLRSFSSYLPGTSCLLPLLPQVISTTVISCLTFNALASFFWLCHLAYGLLVPQPRTAPVSPAMELQSLNHWTAREVPSLASSCFHCPFQSLFRGGNGNPFQYSCWRTPWTETPGGLQSMGSQRVGHN